MRQPNLFLLSSLLRLLAGSITASDVAVVLAFETVEADVVEVETVVAVVVGDDKVEFCEVSAAANSNT